MIKGVVGVHSAEIKGYELGHGKTTIYEPHHLGGMGYPGLETGE